MSKLETGSYKGVRDFYPEDQAAQNYIFSIWRRVLESFGYVEYGASILEPADIYRQKTGDEIVNEQMYVFRDKGEREVALRPEMTPTVARMVAAKRRELGFPLRWYSIPNLFRYEAPQRGRLREHWQLNADIFGVDSIEADREMVRIGYEILKTFGATENDFEIRLNNCKPKDFDGLGIGNLKLDDSLTRGQDYYTGPVFEFFDTNEANKRSILGGGRYDDLLSLFNNDKVPAVGFGMGDVTTRDFLETHGLLPKNISTTHLYIATLGEEFLAEADKLAATLRKGGLNVAVDYTNRKVGDQVKTADKQGVPFFIAFGQNELDSGKFGLKNLKTGEEKEVWAEELSDAILNS